MMRCCYPSMTGWTLGGNISAQVEELRMDASSKGRTWLQEKMAMMKQGDLRKVAAASGVSTRGEDGSPLNHLVDVSTHQKLLQPSASHPASCSPFEGLGT